MAAVMTEARMDSRLVPTQPLYPDTPVTTVHSIGTPMLNDCAIYADRTGLLYFALMMPLSYSA